MARCLWSFYLTFVLFMILLLMITCIQSIEIGCKDGRCSFKNFWETSKIGIWFQHGDIILNFSIIPPWFQSLDTLTWFCKTAKLRRSVPSNFKKMMEYKPHLHRHLYFPVIQTFQNQNFFPWPQPQWRLGLLLNHRIFILQRPYPYYHSPCNIRQP